MSHWSQEEASSDTSWLDNAWTATQRHLNGEVEEISVDDLRETSHGEGIYADANDQLYEIQDGPGGAQYAVPTTAEKLRDAHLEQVERQTFDYFLAAQGVSVDTADPNQLYEAQRQTAEHYERAEQAWGIEHARSLDVAQQADEIALAATMDDFVQEHARGDFESAEPYVDLMMQEMEAGVGFDEALGKAAASLGRWNQQVDTAKREQRFAGMGLADGMSAAFAERRALAETPRPATSSDDAMTAGIGRMAAAVRNKATLKNMARERAKYGG